MEILQFESHRIPDWGDPGLDWHMKWEKCGRSLEKSWEFVFYGEHICSLKSCLLSRFFLCQPAAFVLVRFYGWPWKQGSDSGKVNLIQGENALRVVWVQTDTWTSSGIWMPCQYKTTMSLVSITLRSNQTRSRNIPEYLDQIGPETIRETVVDEVCDDLMRKYQGEFLSRQELM